MKDSVLQNSLLLVGRILFSIIFILAGLQKIVNFNGTVGHIAAIGLPVPELFTVLTIIFELGGALMILLGWHARLGALLILIFVLIVSFAVHHFWTYPVAEIQMQLQNFLKNIAIIGGAIYISIFGPGRYSLDRCKNNNID